MEATTQTAIKASELRIGNWVLMENDEGKRWPMPIDDGIDIDNADCFLPIPLTPEILERCGFVWERSTLFKDNFVIDADYDLNTLPFNFCIQENEEDEDYENHTMILTSKLYYLHQLQNLYFALTGEELQINL